MPNHCFNRVSFYSDNEDHIKELYEIFESGTNPYVDKTVFGQIIPEPDWADTVSYTHLTLPTTSTV